MAADLIPVYYVTGTAASIAVVIGGARSYYARQRRKWTDEGAAAQKNTEALERNTEAATANTRAIGELGTKFDRFADETRKQINGHNVRISRIEDVIEGPMRTRKRGDGQ